MKDVFGNHYQDRLFHLVHWLSIILFLQKTSHESINLERKFYLDCSSDTLCTRGGIWKGDVLIADLEELETMDASEVYSKRLNAKEVIFPEEKGEFIFQSQMDESKPLEEIRTWEHAPRYGSDQFKEKVTLIFLENQKGLFHNHRTHRRMMVKQEMIFGQFQETSYTAITWNPESNCTCRKKNHFLFRWSTSTLREQPTRHLIYCWKNRLMITGTWMEIVNCQMHGQVAQDLFYWMKGHLTDFFMVRGETDEETNDLKTRQCMARYVDAYVWCSEKQGKTKVGYRETKARSCQAITWYFLQQCSVKHQQIAAGKPAAILGTTRPNMLVVGADESMRIRLECAPHWYHEDHISAKGKKSLSQYNLAHKFHPMPQALKIPDAKAAVEKWEKLEKISAWQLTKVRKQKRRDRRSREQGQKCSFRVSDGSMWSQEFGAGASISKIQRSSRTPRRYCDTEQRSSASQMTAAKVMDITARLPGCAGQAADAVSAYTQDKMEDASKSECPDIWIRPPNHKRPKSWSSMEDPVFPLESVRSSFRRTVTGKASRENPVEVRLGKSFQ